MTLEEFEELRARTIVSYAAAHVAAGNWEESFAQVFAARDIDALLPAGPDTPAMLLFSAVLGDGAVVGVLWLALDRGLPGRRRAFRKANSNSHLEMRTIRSGSLCREWT